MTTMPCIGTTPTDIDAELDTLCNTDLGLGSGYVFDGLLDSLDRFFETYGDDTISADLRYAAKSLAADRDFESESTPAPLPIRKNTFNRPTPTPRRRVRPIGKPFDSDYDLRFN